MTTFRKKLEISFLSSSVFFLTNLPQTYQFTNKLFPFATEINGCPTNLGIIVHTIVFLILSFLLMLKSKQNIEMKIKNSLFATLIFFLLSNPTTYSVVGNLFNTTKNKWGCPNWLGIVVHTLVYCLFLLSVMYLPE